MVPTSFQCYVILFIQGNQIKYCWEGKARGVHSFISKQRVKKKKKTKNKTHQQNMHASGQILSMILSQYNHVTVLKCNKAVLNFIYLSNHLCWTSGQFITPQQTSGMNFEPLFLKSWGLVVWQFSNIFFNRWRPLSFYQWNQGPNTLKQTKSVFTDPYTKSTWIPWVHRPQIEKHWAKENILLAVSSIGDMTYSSAMLILSIQGEGSVCTCAHYTRTRVIALLGGLGLI